MDISDGLAGDLTKLCGASGVSAEIETAQVPFSAGAKRLTGADPVVRELAVTGGDDYEVLCTMAPEKVASFQAAVSAAGVTATEIGRIVAGQGARFVDAAGRALTFARGSYSHF